ncbi:hypothetical protein Tco_0876019 [Tanacetum coccineum]|uniref:Retrovirus-related Pol polyprotein from transposon TNT 1-94-like beta-barrel domain-containing protein n=1 Tax=Tanacetum coccineum TaxID=301880 RepID=A0ABQ5BUK4_9ASTR
MHGYAVSSLMDTAYWSSKTGNPQQKEYKEKGVIDSGCSRHMTGNKCYLLEYEDYDGGFVSFGDGKGRISGKGKSKEVGTPRYLSLVVPLKKVGDEDVHKELGDRMERAATTASSLEAKQDNGSGPRCQDTILGGVDAQTRTLIIASSIMANLEFYDTHNMVAYLLKPEGSEIFNFWQTASTSTLEDGAVEITTTIDGQLKTITEASLRRHLKLEDADGISSLPNFEIFEQLALMGYASDSNKLTFQKGYFSSQWRFLIHTILHCLSPKKNAWE